MIDICTEFLQAYLGSYLITMFLQLYYSKLLEGRYYSYFYISDTVSATDTESLAMNICCSSQAPSSLDEMARIKWLYNLLC